MNINFNKQSGFTLIELMIVISIVAILAAIAIPSYRSYTINNRQQQAKGDMLSAAGELEQWRARNLNYSGFIPKSGYVDATSSKFQSPKNSDSKRYDVSVYSFKNESGVITIEEIKGATAGLNWFVVATPIADSTSSGLHSYLLTSDGTRCSAPNKTNFDSSAKLIDLIGSRNCGLESGDWQ